MGTVEVALRREGAFRRVSAVKRPHPHLVEDEDVRAMFLDEARVAGLVRHANVVSVLDVGEDERGPFLVLDYVEGLDLATVLKHHAARGELLPLQVALRLVAQAASGLQAAHELAQPDGTPLGLVHRDVSPQNILVGFDGIARITDFGIARAFGRSSKLTAAGLIKGKLGYMAPEQLRYEEPDARTDVFALGVVLFEACAGRRLYADDGERAVPLRILTEPPPDLGDERDDVPPALVELVFAMLAKDHADRPADAGEVARRLDAILADLLRDEEPVAIAGYLQTVFGDERRRAAERLASAMREADDLETKTALAATTAGVEAPLATPRARGPMPLVGAAVVFAIVAAVVVVRTRAGAASPDATTLATTTPATTTMAPAAGASVAEPASSASDTSSASAPVASVSPSASARPGPRGGARTAAPRSTGIPMWGWK